MAKLFDSVRIGRPRRNKFDLSHERKMSMDMGDIVPVMVQEIVPGDSFRVKTEVMMRFAPMLAPIMHRVNVFTHYFFVPNRLVWKEWEDFITGGRLGTSLPVAPYARIGAISPNQGVIQGKLGDYMGIPNYDFAGGIDVDTNISMLPFRAYQLIYDEYYRDQNLTAKVTDFAAFKDSGEVIGGNIGILLQMRKRAWEKDYFTSALPFAQRGGSVSMPISSDKTVTTQTYRIGAGGVEFSQAGDMTIGANADVLMTGSASQDGGVHVGPEGHGVDINLLRRSIRLQEWLEKNARGGARYIEQILSHFGVKSSDARLQRPEYLGGGKTPVVVSEVLSTFQADAGVIPQGNMAGHGVSFGTTNGFKKSFEEHGYVIGVMSVIPRTAYQQGIPRHLTRFDKFDYFWPEFGNIGEQEVKNKELYYTGNTGEVPDGTFGYQSRYAEYKYGCSSVHGEFRNSLDFWHMGRVFAAPPVLNASFIESDPTSRIFAVESAPDKLYCHLYNRVDALRPMPYFGTPMI